jgi:hypothetical protein
MWIHINVTQFKNFDILVALMLITYERSKHVVQRLCIINKCSCVSIYFVFIVYRALLCTRPYLRYCAHTTGCIP